MGAHATNTTRTRGRPSRKDATDLRRDICRKAGDLFAELGPDATTMQQVADVAGVDRRLVYHYFGGKDQLYLEVLGQSYGQLTVLADRLSERSDTLEQYVEALFDTYFQFCVENPAFVRMLMWENLRDVRGLRRVASASNVLAVSRQKLGALIEHAAAAGRCRAQLDPEMLLIECLGLVFFYFSNAHSLGLVLGRDLREASMQQKWSRHAVNSILHSVRPTP